MDLTSHQCLCADGQQSQFLLHSSLPGSLRKGGQTLKNIHTRVHMPAEVTDMSGTWQGGPPFPLWFRLLLSDLVCLPLLLTIDSSWHPLGTAFSCHFSCCSPPAVYKSLWHESIKKIMVFLYTTFYSFMLWTSQIISPSVVSIIA